MANNWYQQAYSMFANVAYSDRTNAMYPDHEDKLVASGYTSTSREFDLVSTIYTIHDDDTDSISSYASALEELEDQDVETTQAASFEASLPDEILPCLLQYSTTQRPRDGGITGIPGRHWHELISEHGESPGVKYEGGELEVFNIPFASCIRSPARLIGPGYINMKRIQDFCRAEIRFMKCHPPYSHGIRIIGTVEQAHYALQACKAVLYDESVPIVYWVILKLAGPKLLSTARAFRECVKDIVPEKNFVDEESLHVTAAWLDFKEDDRLAELIDIVARTVSYLNEINTVKSLTGEFREILRCRFRSVAARPQSADDPIENVQKFILNILKEHDFPVIGPSYAHMTLMITELANGARPGGAIPVSNNMLRERGFKPDFGPVQVTGIEISCKVKQLDGYSYPTLAHFPLTPRAA